MHALSSLILRRHGHHHHHHHHHHLLVLLLHKRAQSISTVSASQPSPPPRSLEVPLCHPTYFIWSSNTSLGKTLVSTGLASSFLFSLPNKKFLYLKPVQTGFPVDSDSGFLSSKLSSLSQRLRIPLSLSNSVLKTSVPVAKSLLRDSNGCEFGIFDYDFHEEKKILGASELVSKTLYAWEEAVSPHLAAERENALVEDSDVVSMLESNLQEGLKGGIQRAKTDVMCVVETAGGVASPGPSGTLQCDLYRPFRLPGVLVGDGRLGGISGTISAYESLKIRGYDVVAVVLEDHGLNNETSLMSYLRHKVPVLVLPSIPKDPSNDLMEWFDKSQDVFTSLKGTLLSAYSERIQKLHDMPKRAGEVFWWPFTQHKLVSKENVTVIDSRCGENFAVYKDENNTIAQQFDGCASWWTQGPDMKLQTELAREIGYVGARYGHVMFPENVHEPALECAELLLAGVGRGWASRTYFSDNGSTAIEIALKMAFRKYCCDHGIPLDLPKNNVVANFVDLKVLALKGSYHGDTLGAMEAQSPSSYTGFPQQPWYTGRGLFLDPPTVFMSNSVWNVSLPECWNSETQNLNDKTFMCRDEIFDKKRDGSDLARVYSKYISQQLGQYSGSTGLSQIGALIVEPVIQGAGGMLMIDPLFQRVLAAECRSRKVPVIFDEVFTGFWRLGAETATEFLGCQPDIACFAKLMTGGVIPLAATLATDAVFDSFTGDSKLDALLHGHSYTAHAMGCIAAVKSIKWFKDPQTNPNIASDGKFLRELWDGELVQQISSHPAVQRVVALGTLFALELRADGSNAGYASLYAKSLLQMLCEDGIYMRPLGNVIYLMSGPCTSPEICRQQLIKLYRRLDMFTQVGQV